MKFDIWDKCLLTLEKEIPAQEYKIWVLPLQARLISETRLILFAPNKFVIEFVKKRFLSNISSIIAKLSDNLITVELQVGSIKRSPDNQSPRSLSEKSAKMTENKHKSSSQKSVNFSDITSTKNNDTFTNAADHFSSSVSGSGKKIENRFRNYQSALSKEMTFDNFVEGKCNMLARAAALQIVETISEGGSNNNYNPFLIYGGVGLGKTHLIHALGNIIMSDNPDSRVIYLNSERFVQEMITPYKIKLLISLRIFIDLLMYY